MSFFNVFNAILPFQVFSTNHNARFQEVASTSQSKSPNSERKDTFTLARPTLQGGTTFSGTRTIDVSSGFDPFAFAGIPASQITSYNNAVDNNSTPLPELQDVITTPSGTRNYTAVTFDVFTGTAGDDQFSAESGANQAWYQGLGGDNTYSGNATDGDRTNVFAISGTGTDTIQFPSSAMANPQIVFLEDINGNGDGSASAAEISGIAFKWNNTAKTDLRVTLPTGKVIIIENYDVNHTATIGTSPIFFSLNHDTTGDPCDPFLPTTIEDPDPDPNPTPEPDPDPEPDCGVIHNYIPINITARTTSFSEAKAFSRSYSFGLNKTIQSVETDADSDSESASTSA